ncbi:MAG: zinc-binding dehydrogenase [Lachnospiraceae bacterium]|nr:zinc-binding dehydrogenase [Lachnospiraceae bacterium]
MRAAIYQGVKSVTMGDVDKPVIKDDDILIKVEKAGICGTDVGAYLYGGDALGIYPGNQFGHEFVGTVCEAGCNVKDIPVGMRVTINPTARRPLSCGMNSTEIADMSGAFSEYVYVEEAQLGYNVLALPDTLSFDKGVLAEPLSVSTHGVSIVDAKAGEKALVYGAGTIGLSAVAALQKKGITDIIVSDINEFKLGFAEKMGAITFNPEKGSLVDFVKEQWGTCIGNVSEETWNVDVVIDCAGAPFITKEFMDNAKIGSRLSIVAINMTPAEFSPFFLLAKEVKICGSRGYTPQDIQTAIDTLNDPECKLPEIITHVFPHEEFPDAIEQASHAAEAVKVVIDYR